MSIPALRGVRGHSKARRIDESAYYFASSLGLRRSIRQSHAHQFVEMLQHIQRHDFRSIDPRIVPFRVAPTAVDSIRARTGRPAASMAAAMPATMTGRRKFNVRMIRLPNDPSRDGSAKPGVYHTTGSV